MSDTPRDGRGQFLRTPETADRDRQAADLRSQGWTLQQIADELGYSNKGTVSRAVRRAIRDIVKEPAEKLLALHMERLEALYEAALEVLEDEEDSAPKLAAIREARATLESFRKLTGLDQPAKVNVSGGVRYELVGIDPEQLK